MKFGCVPVWSKKNSSVRDDVTVLFVALKNRRDNHHFVLLGFATNEFRRRTEPFCCTRERAPNGKHKKQTKQSKQKGQFRCAGANGTGWRAALLQQTDPVLAFSANSIHGYFSRVQNANGMVHASWRQSTLVPNATTTSWLLSARRRTERTKSAKQGKEHQIKTNLRLVF